MSHPVPFPVGEFADLGLTEPKQTIEFSGDGVFQAFLSSRSACLAKVINADSFSAEEAKDLVSFFGANSDMWTVRDLKAERRLLDCDGGPTTQGLSPFLFKLQVVNRYPFDELTRSVHKAVFDSDYRLLLPSGFEIIGADLVIGQNGIMSFGFAGLVENGWSSGAIATLFGSGQQKSAVSKAFADQASFMTGKAVATFASFPKSRGDKSVTRKVIPQKVPADSPEFKSAHFLLSGEIEAGVSLSGSHSTAYSMIDPSALSTTDTNPIWSATEHIQFGSSVSLLGTKAELGARMSKIAFVLRTCHALYARYVDSCAQAERLYRSEKDLSANDFAKLHKRMTLNYLRLIGPIESVKDETAGIRGAILDRWDIQGTRERADYLISAMESRSRRRRFHQEKEFQVAVQGLLMIMLLIALVGGFADMRILGWPP